MPKSSLVGTTGLLLEWLLLLVGIGGLLWGLFSMNNWIVFLGIVVILSAAEVKRKLGNQEGKE